MTVSDQLLLSHLAYTLYHTTLPSYYIARLLPGVSKSMTAVKLF